MPWVDGAVAFSGVWPRAECAGDGTDFRAKGMGSNNTGVEQCGRRVCGLRDSPDAPCQSLGHTHGFIRC